MPGLIRGVARTAVIAGTATHVSNNVSKRQHGRWANQQAQADADAYARQQHQQAQMAQQAPPPQYQQAPPPYQQAPPPYQQAPPPPGPEAASTVDLVAEIQKLVDLKNMGALSEAEFEVAKARVLNG